MKDVLIEPKELTSLQRIFFYENSSDNIHDPEL